MAKKRTFKDMMTDIRAKERQGLPTHEGASTIATQEDVPATQQMLSPAVPAPAPVMPDSEVNLDAPALEAPSEGAPQDESEESVITKAMKALGDRLREAAPHVDFTGEYKKLLEENKRPERKGISPFKAFAISLGGGQPALNKLEERNTAQNDETENRWRETMRYREEALKGDIEQKLGEGKFKQALAQSEELAKMNSILERIKDKRNFQQDIDKIKEQNKGRKDVAEIKASQAREALQSKLTSMADAYKLEGDLRKEFFKAQFRALAQRMVAQDITGEQVVGSDDLAGVLQQSLDWAEEHTGIDFSKPQMRPSSLGGPKPASAQVPTNETPEQKALREIREGK